MEDIYLPNHSLASGKLGGRYISSEPLSRLVFFVALQTGVGLQKHKCRASETQVSGWFQALIEAVDVPFDLDFAYQNSTFITVNVFLVTFE